ncbi:flagellar hook-basal body protein [Alteribacter natronophilus]|uniref:flagellar hook-basal body protein n=1 Tax=Alteribacter natronophilus TaxID=2583810 RepID=UPI00110DE1D3|nr:flagellar hook-basal body protein [Alteribacter natronophilus]TMW72191.1 flagellar hook-basal body protein [Alteribacter natronophilus]
MNQSMINSAVTLGQLQHKMDTTSNNLANLNTTGYNRRDVTFSSLLSQQIHNQPAAEQEIGRMTPGGIRVGTGGAVAQTAVRFEQGALNRTGRDLDIALTEPGYFFELAEGEDGNRRLTRDGAFYLTPGPAAGGNSLVNQNGESVLGADGQPVTIPADYQAINVTEAGMVTVTMQDGTVEEAGQLQLVQVTKPQVLESSGGNVFTLPAPDELNLDEEDVLNGAAGTDIFMQGSLEQSNVDMAKEMNDMLQTQRNFQFHSRAISIGDEMRGLVNGLR